VVAIAVEVAEAIDGRRRPREAFSQGIGDAERGVDAFKFKLDLSR
jgi:hypothetical protein